jgi:hypothetical protein
MQVDGVMGALFPPVPWQSVDIAMSAIISDFCAIGQGMPQPDASEALVATILAADAPTLAGTATSDNVMRAAIKVRSCVIMIEPCGAPPKGQITDKCGTESSGLEEHRPS